MGISRRKDRNPTGGQLAVLLAIAVLELSADPTFNFETFCGVGPSVKLSYFEPQCSLPLSWGGAQAWAVRLLWGSSLLWRVRMDSRIPCEGELTHRVRAVKGGRDRLQLVIQFDWSRGVFPGLELFCFYHLHI